MKNIQMLVVAVTKMILFLALSLSSYCKQWYETKYKDLPVSVMWCCACLQQLRDVCGNILIRRPSTASKKTDTAYHFFSVSLFFSESKRPCWWCLSRPRGSRKWQEDGLCLPVSSHHSGFNCSQSLPVKSSILKTLTIALDVIDLMTNTGIIVVCVGRRNAEMILLKGLFLQWVTFASLAQVIKSFGRHVRRVMLRFFSQSSLFVASTGPITDS